MELQDRIKENRIGRLVYKQSLLGALAVTKAVQKLEYPIPNHWKMLIETVSVTSSVAHEQISFLDEEVQKDFRRKERRINQVLGQGEPLYSKDELEKLRDHRDDIRIPEYRKY